MTRATLLKDLRMEWRSKDAINSMLFFSLLVVVIFSFAFNPDGGRVATHRRRVDLGGVSVRGGGGAESDLGARAAQSGAGCLSRIARAAQCAVSGQGAGEFPVRRGSGSTDGAAVRRVLPAALGGAGVAVDRGGAARDLGAGGERHFFRGALHPHPQPRDHAAAAFSSPFRFRRCSAWWTQPRRS